MLGYMLRAIFFDFYGVWVPDRFDDLITKTASSNENMAAQLREILHAYYIGLIDLDILTSSFKLKLDQPDLDLSNFKLEAAHISPDAIKFIQYLHSHFIKVGILASLGAGEHKILSDLDVKYKLFENITDTYSLGLPLLSKEVFIQALRGIGEPKDSCTIVTGHQDFAEFAKTLGINTISYAGFPSLTQTITKLL